MIDQPTATLCRCGQPLDLCAEMIPPGPKLTVPPLAPIGFQTQASAEVRFWRRVEAMPTGCWEWRGGRHSAGYGKFDAGHRVHDYAHRYAFAYFYGSIPPGLTLDHLCRNRLCVNPTHLEAVTLDENKRRGMSPAAVAMRRTHCIHGHAWDSQNTYFRPDTGTRQCRACHRDRDRAK